MGVKEVLLCATFVIFGLTALLPWNLFINASEYFEYKFRNISAPSDSNVTSHLQSIFENYFAVTGTATTLLGVIINTFLTRKLSNKLRMRFGHTCLIASLTCVAILTQINSTDSWQYGFFGLTLALMMLSVCGSSFVQGSGGGLAALFPPYCMQAFFIGQAGAGVLASVLDVISLAVVPNVRTSALIYFVIAILVVVLSQITEITLTRSSYLREQLLESATKIAESKVVSSDELPSYQNGKSESKSALVDESGLSQGPTGHEKEAKHLSTWENIRTILIVVRKTLIYGLVPVVIFGVTLSCFPALTQKVTPSNQGAQWKKYFTAVCCFLLFNCGDFTGRSLSNVFRWPKFGTGYLLLGMSLLRIAFIPVFIYCSVDTSPRARHTTAVFTEDWEFILWMAAFAVTNGYFTNVAAAYLPRTVNPDEAELAGALISVYCLTGIFIGPLISLGVVLIP